jgi:hypothetical protein
MSVVDAVSTVTTATTDGSVNVKKDAATEDFTAGAILLYCPVL